VWRIDKFSSNAAHSVQWYISSKHSREMSQMSKVVSVGVHPHYNYYHMCTLVGLQLLNENKVDEMSTIIHKCVPKATHQVLQKGADLPVDEDFYHGILFGWDQLTVCRSCAAQAARYHDDTSIGKLTED